MTKARLEQILWERDNAFEKFKEHAHEYFAEVIGFVKLPEIVIPAKHVVEVYKKEIKKPMFTMKAKKK